MVVRLNTSDAVKDTTLETGDSLHSYHELIKRDVLDQIIVFQVAELSGWARGGKDKVHGRLAVKVDRVSLGIEKDLLTGSIESDIRK